MSIKFKSILRNKLHPNKHCTQGIDPYFLRMSNCVWQLPEFCGLLPEGLSKAVYKISAHWLH